jgi:hypothetical protein
MNSKIQSLLEGAAKAAGLKNPRFVENTSWGTGISHGEGDDVYFLWNPLTSDGDAFRLAVVCMVSFGFYRFFKQCLKTLAARRGLHDDPYEVVRYVVVEAAATLVENK